MPNSTLSNESLNVTTAQYSYVATNTFETKYEWEWREQSNKTFVENLRVRPVDALQRMRSESNRTNRQFHFQL